MKTSSLHSRALFVLIAMLFSGCELDNATPKLTKDINDLGTKLEATQAKIEAASKTSSRSARR